MYIPRGKNLGGHLRILSTTSVVWINSRHTMLSEIKVGLVRIHT